MTSYEKDLEFLGRDAAPFNLELEKSSGSYLYDKNGRRYIDFLMGWSVGNIGWGNKEVKDKIKEFDGPEYVNPTYVYKPWADLAEILAQITPGKLKKSFRATGGTEAVEIALQAAMSHTKRSKFISVKNAYHGHSLGTMSVGPDYFRTKFDNLLPGCDKIALPLDIHAGFQVQRLLETKEYAAFISEPIICNLGVVIPEAKFFEIVQDACKRTGTVLIIDEVATGFGRTGKMFASEHYNLEPDIMCLAKAMTGGYGPLGTAIMTDEIAKSMEFDFSSYSTYGWHPIGVSAALATISLILHNKENFFLCVNSTSNYFKERLTSIKFKFPTEVRISGLAIGIESEKEGYTTKIAQECETKGLLFHAFDDHKFVLYPALNIPLDIAKTGLDILESCT